MIQEEIFQLEQEIFKKREQIQGLRKKQKRKTVQNYSFLTIDGEVKLSELFGSHDFLFLVHNMGSHCPYCTMWADGFNSTYEKIAERAALVISSPDDPIVQGKFSEEKGWFTPMVSVIDSSFKKDFEKVITYGGISLFLKDEEGIHLYTQSLFEPGDSFGILYNVFDLLPLEVIPHG